MNWILLKISSRVVVDISGNNLVLSAKLSLINLAEQLPSDISQIHHNTVIHVSN